MSNSKYRQARDLSAIKIARLRAQTPALGSSVKASFKPTATTLKAGIWQSFGDGPGGNDPPRPGYRMAREVAVKRITLPKVSILED
jgi:hypothetical protein